MINRIPLETFFERPNKSSFQLSPNGKYISYLEKNNSAGMELMILNKQTNHTISITGYKNIEEDTLSDYFWKTDNFIFLSIDNDGDENDVLFKYDINNDKLTKYFNDNTSTTFLVELLDNNDNELIVANNSRDKKWFDLYRINLYNDELTLIFKNTKNITDWLFDNDGELRIVKKVNNGLDHYYFKENGKYKKLFSLNFTESFSPICFDRTNSNIYAVHNINSNFAKFVLYDPRVNKMIKEIYSVNGYDIGGVWINKNIELKAIYWDDWRSRQKIYCTKIQEVFNHFNSIFDTAKYDISITDSTDDELEFLVLISNDRVPGKLYYYDAVKKVSKLLYTYIPALEENDLTNMKPISYLSVDELKIHGYLSLPKAYSKSNPVPLIVIPHGGPWHRDGWGYDGEVQFFANRGYAVLQVNFRGSIGYGKEFWKAGFKEWGQKMQDDITIAVKKLIKKGIVDKNKIAIYGGSYGGYAALMGLIKNPELYCCGISYVGVTNLLTFMDTIPEYWKSEITQMYTMVGDPKNDTEYMKQNSPVFNVKKIKAPVLVIHGKNDPRVNINEYEQLINKLNIYNKTYDTLLMDDEGHGSKKEKNTLQVYKKIEQFLNNYLGE